MTPVTTVTHYDTALINAVTCVTGVTKKFSRIAKSLFQKAALPGAIRRSQEGALNPLGERKSIF